VGSCADGRRRERTGEREHTHRVGSAGNGGADGEQKGGGEELHNDDKWVVWIAGVKVVGFESSRVEGCECCMDAVAVSA
jgi:hypothetical protein